MLISEVIFIFGMGMLVGVLLPERTILRIREAVSQSAFIQSTHSGFYLALATAVFLIVHQHICWVWLLKVSKQHFTTRNWGRLIFYYGCTGLLVFSLGIVCWKVGWS